MCKESSLLFTKRKYPMKLHMAGYYGGSTAK